MFTCQPPDSPHHDPAIRVSRSLYGLPCHSRCAILMKVLMGSAKPIYVPV